MDECRDVDDGGARLRAVLGQPLPGLVRILALDLLVMVLSLSVHECAHAWVAFLLGDPTAQPHGRLSSSPVSHHLPSSIALHPASTIFYALCFRLSARPRSH